MSGERDLETLLASMDPVLMDGIYVFATCAPKDVPPGLTPKMMFQEVEGTTLILLEQDAKAHGLVYEFPSRMITLNVHSSLDAVGFLARITTALAKHKMGVNPVSAFFHDHIFVPLGREDEAMTVLRGFARLP